MRDSHFTEFAVIPGDHQPHRVTMFGIERLVAHVIGEDHVSFFQPFERHVFQITGRVYILQAAVIPFRTTRGIAPPAAGRSHREAEAIEAIQKYGTMVKSPSGYPIQSPYVSIANRQAEIMMRIASEFGFTPASRSRISAPSEPQRSLFDLVEPHAGPDPHKLLSDED